MTSKSSFWVSLRENNRKRTWLWVVSWLYFLLCYIVGTALVISGQKSSIQRLEQLRQITDGEKQQLITETVGYFLGSTALLFLGASVLAVFCAVQGFSYLYHRKKVDLYHSLPVRKSSRFAVIWVNGLFIYLIPSLIGIMGGILVAAMQGAMNTALLYDICIKYIVTLLLYISLYNLAIIAVMLTGHMVITLFAIIVLQTYEYLVQLLVTLYKEEFFEKFGSFSMNWVDRVWLSPYSVYWSDMNWNQVTWTGAMMPAGKLIFLSLLFLVIAYLCYWKRPSEAAGRAMTFGVTKPVIKIGIVVPASMAAALIIKVITSGYEVNADSGSPWFIAFAILAGTVLGCCLMEVIYEFDIKACLHKKKHIIISGALTTVLFLGFRFDVTGYDDYIPESSKVESYALLLNSADLSFIDENGNYRSASSYIGEHMFVTDGAAICQLASMQPDQDWEESVLVRYRLKNGRTVERTVWLDYSNPETDVLLNRIVSNPEYKKGSFMVMADYYDKWLAGNDRQEIRTRFSMGAYSYKIPEEAVGRLVEAYRRDLEFINYTDLSQTLPMGMIEFSAYKKEDGEKSPYTFAYNQIKVYPDCVQTIACLKELGLYREKVIDLEDVERVEVINYNQNQYERDSAATVVYYDSGPVSKDMEDKTVTITYTDRGEIQEVCQVIWPVFYNGGERYDGLIEENYEVTVYFKKGTNPYEHDSMVYGYKVLKGKMPFFIQEATKYIEK